MKYLLYGGAEFVRILVSPTNIRREGQQKHFGTLSNEESHALNMLGMELISQHGLEFQYKAGKYTIDTEGGD